MWANALERKLLKECKSLFPIGVGTAAAGAGAGHAFMLLLLLLSLLLSLTASTLFSTFHPVTLCSCRASSHASSTESFAAAKQCMPWSSSLPWYRLTACDACGQVDCFRNLLMLHLGLMYRWGVMSTSRVVT
jgi:hypothetical protein